VSQKEKAAGAIDARELSAKDCVGGVEALGLSGAVTSAAAMRRWTAALWTLGWCIVLAASASSEHRRLGIYIPTVGRPALLESVLAGLFASADAAAGDVDARVFVLLDADDVQRAVRTIAAVAQWPRAHLLLPHELPPAMNLTVLARGGPALADRSVHLAHVYRAMLQVAFERHGLTHAVFWEDDLQPSSDAVTYFAAAAAALDADPTLWCASAWSDNGYMATARDETAVLRGEVGVGPPKAASPPFPSPSLRKDVGRLANTKPLSWFSVHAVRATALYGPRCAALKSCASDHALS